MAEITGLDMRQQTIRTGDLVAFGGASRNTTVIGRITEIKNDGQRLIKVTVKTRTGRVTHRFDEDVVRLEGP